METFKIEIPELCLVVLVGGSSSGKSTFARRYFKSTEVLSSDFFRGMITDNENDQEVSGEAFELLYLTAKKRLSHGKLTVVDATNLRKEDRRKVLAIAKEENVHAAAIVFDLPDELLLARNRERTDRVLPERVIRHHRRELRQSAKGLKREGFRFVYFIDSEEKADNAEIVRTKLWNDRKDWHGPFDIIGDVHGCCDELERLLEKLGYVKTEAGYAHPGERKAAFLGDFCDRGNRNADVLRLVMDMVKAGNAFAVVGNHDAKLLKYLQGKEIKQAYGIEKTITELEARGEDFKAEAAAFLDGLISHYVLDDGELGVGVVLARYLEELHEHDEAEDGEGDRADDHVGCGRHLGVEGAAVAQRVPQGVHAA